MSQTKTKDIEVGQVWVTRGGGTAEVVGHDPGSSYPWDCIFYGPCYQEPVSGSVTAEGNEYDYGGRESPNDFSHLNEFSFQKEASPQVVHLAKDMVAGRYELKDEDGVLSLVKSPEKCSRWGNIYPDGRCNLHPTKSAANVACASDRVACVRIDYTEGEGL